MPRPAPWTQAQDDRVRKIYRLRGGIARLVRELGRTVFAIQMRAHRLGVSRRPRRWTREEKKILRAEWGEVGERTLRAKLPGRSTASIVQKAKALGLPPQIAGRDTIPACARRLGVNRRTVLRLISDAGAQTRRAAPLSIKRRGAAVWAAVDMELAETLLRLRDLRCSSMRAYAARLGLPELAVARRCRAMGVQSATPPGGKACVPCDVLAEVMRGSPGAACDLWAQALQASPGVCAPWVLWLAVRDLQADPRVAWVADVLPLKTLIAARVLAGLRPDAEERAA